MPTNTTDETVQTLNIVKEIEIAAPIAIAFDAVLAELGPPDRKCLTAPRSR